MDSSCFAAEWACSSVAVKIRLSFLRSGVWKDRSLTVRTLEGSSFAVGEANTATAESSFCRFAGGEGILDDAVLSTLALYAGNSESNC